jgi:hypothetical protein
VLLSTDRNESENEDKDEDFSFAHFAFCSSCGDSNREPLSSLEAFVNSMAWDRGFFYLSEEMDIRGVNIHAKYSLLVKSSRAVKAVLILPRPT